MLGLHPTSSFRMLPIKSSKVQQYIGQPPKVKVTTQHQASILQHACTSQKYTEGYTGQWSHPTIVDSSSSHHGSVCAEVAQVILIECLNVVEARETMDTVARRKMSEAQSSVATATCASGCAQSRIANILVTCETTPGGNTSYRLCEC